MISLSSLGRRSFFIVGLSCFLLPQIAFAQPPSVPSTIKKPFAGGIPVPIPDPPLISLAELQKLTGGPTLVTLSGTDLPLAEVGKTLFETARLPVNKDYALGFGKLSVNWNRTPFWSAAADMEKQTASVWRTSSGETLSLIRFGDNSEGGFDGKLAAINPYVSLVAYSLTRTETATTLFRRNQAPIAPTARGPFDGVRIEMAAYFDPTLQIQSTTLRSLVFQKQGETAPLAQEDGNLVGSYGSNGLLISQLRLLLPKTVGAGTTFSRISGVLHTVLISAIQQLTVADLVATPQVNKEINGHQYALQSVAVTDDTLTLRLKVGEGEAADRNRSLNQIFSFLRVRDFQGNALRRSSGSFIGGSRTQNEISFDLKNFKGETVSGPYSLEWPITTETRSFDVPFELRDITVP